MLGALDDAPLEVTIGQVALSVGAQTRPYGKFVGGQPVKHVGPAGDVDPPDLHHAQRRFDGAEVGPLGRVAPPAAAPTVGPAPPAGALSTAAAGASAKDAPAAPLSTGTGTWATSGTRARARTGHPGDESGKCQAGSRCCLRSAWNTSR